MEAALAARVRREELEVRSRAPKKFRLVAIEEAAKAALATGAGRKVLAIEERSSESVLIGSRDNVSQQSQEGRGWWGGFSRKKHI